MNPWIGRFSVKGVKPDSKGDFMVCKLKARLNLHGILNMESGYYVEDVEVEEPIPEERDEKKVAEKKDPDVSYFSHLSAISRVMASHLLVLCHRWFGSSSTGRIRRRHPLPSRQY